MSKHAAAKCAVGLLAVAALGACAPKEVPIVEHQGACTEVFQAQVCTWARMQGDSVIDIGALVPLAMVENAPKEGAMAWPPVPAANLTLPEAAQQATGLKHMTIFWESMGHPPGPYLTPHFDSAWGVAVQTDGSVVCSGVSGAGGSHASFAVLRYQP